MTAPDPHPATVTNAAGDEPDTLGLFDGDTGDAPADARMVITYLTRNRILLGRDEPDMWDALLAHEAAVTRHFHNMYVDLLIHRASRVAFKQQVTPDRAQFSITVRAVTLTREASVLVLFARERLAHAVPGETVVLTRSDARSQMEPYWPAHVSNMAAKEKKVNGALDSLVQQDLLIKTGDDQWEVSPAVAHVLTAQAVARFTDLLTAPDTDGDAGRGSAVVDYATAAGNHSEEEQGEDQ
jgi:hypothetical protein